MAAVIPNFVVVKTRGGPGTALSAGYLNPRNAPLLVTDIKQGMPLLHSRDQRPVVDTRARLMEEADLDFMRQFQATSIEAHRTAYKQACG